MRIFNSFFAIVFMFSNCFTLSMLAQDLKKTSNKSIIQPVTEIKISVENTTAFLRKDETVEIDWTQIKEKIKNIEPNQFIIINANSKKQITYQVMRDEKENPISLIFQVNIKPNEQANFEIKIGTPNYFNSKTFGRFVPERNDDFAWENDRIAHRMYGPALESETISNGVDVWVKSTRELILNKWYKLNDYDIDHGEGLDCYKVGPSLGAGGIAPYINGKFYKPQHNFISSKVIANGPIRTVFMLKYAPWNVEDREVSETKTISIDAGSNLTRYESVYEAKTNDTLQVAVGINKRKQQGKVLMDEIDGLISYLEPENNPNGTMGIGVIMTDTKHVSMTMSNGHYLAISQNVPGQKFIYYAGAYWDKSEDFKDFEEWSKYLNIFKAKLNTPLKIVFL